MKLKDLLIEQELPDYFYNQYGLPGKCIPIKEFINMLIGESFGNTLEITFNSKNRHVPYDRILFSFNSEWVYKLDEEKRFDIRNNDRCRIFNYKAFILLDELLKLT